MNDLDGIRMGIRLDIKDVGVTLGGERILAGISCTVLPGELVGLLGPSGAGKSTLLYAALGLRKPRRGSVLLNGLDLYTHYDQVKFKIGYVPQDDILHRSLTVEKVLYYTGLLRLPPDRTAEIEPRIRDILQLLHLTDRRRTRIKRLSGGQRKRVNIAIELMTEPPLLMLDEPTAGLDPALEESTMELFKKLALSGRTMVVTTHVMDSVRLFDLVVLLSGGWTVFIGPPGEAPAFFGVQSFADIYSVLSVDNPMALHNVFTASEYYRRYVTARAALPISSFLSTDPRGGTPASGGVPADTTEAPKPRPAGQRIRKDGDTSAAEREVPSKERILEDIESQLEELKRRVYGTDQE
ncbi:ABC transporter ATP-binding protein [bacterium]|nr:ABC transporter ATP-binding protein [candidate division CSSED10-310 bacterium]